jgi:hypothetical protein
MERRTAASSRNSESMMSWSRLTDRTLSDVENRDRHASVNTCVIGRALDWQPGSIDMILAGGEPIEEGIEEPQDEPKVVALDIRDVSIRELVEELGRRLDAYGLRLSRSRLQGLVANRLRQAKAKQR